MLEGKGYCNWLMIDLEGTKEIKEINFTFEKIIYTEFAVALSDDRKNLRKIYQSGKRPALTYLSLKAEERTRSICLLLTGSETGVRKIDIYA